MCATLFRGLRFFLGREVPREQLLLVLRAFGAEVGWDSPASPFTEQDEAITHQVRPCTLSSFPSSSLLCPFNGTCTVINHPIILLRYPRGAGTSLVCPSSAVPQPQGCLQVGYPGYPNSRDTATPAGVPVVCPSRVVPQHKQGGALAGGTR